MRKFIFCLLILSAFFPKTVSSADFKFVVYSDIQGGGEGNHAKLPGIISRIPGGVTCAVSCGDMAGLGNYDTATATTWDFHLATALNLGTPFWPCRGNHDGVEDAAGITMSNWKNSMSFIRERSEYQSGSPDNDYYSFMYNNCLFVVLNNMNGTKAPETAWIASEIATDRAKNATHIFVFQHYALLGYNLPDSIQANYRWEKYIAPYFENMPNFAGAFWGDRHVFWKGDYKGKTGVLVPPGTTPREGEGSAGPGELTGEFSGYIVVHVKGDSVTGKAYTYSEVEQASFVVKGYDPLGKLPITSVTAFTEDNTIEKYLQTRVGAVIAYRDTFNGNITIFDTTYALKYLSLSTNATVDTSGYVIGTALGTAQIVVTKRSISDTVDISVVSSTLPVDSIRLSADSISLLAGDSFIINATGYFHNTSGSFSRNIGNDVTWSSTSPSNMSVTQGMVKAISAGPSKVIASMGGVFDTCMFTILPRPAFLCRINFKTDTVSHAPGWRGDNGRIYSAARGIGWVTSTSTTTRGDRNGGILLGSFVAKSTETSFKIDAPDGRYILKIGVGDNKYNATTLITHETQQIVSHSGISNAIVADTITVTGGTGIVLKVSGVLCYLVAISSEGIPIDMVAEDGNLPLMAQNPPSTTSESAFSSAQNDIVSFYPNPFNPVVNISFNGSISHTGKTLTIIDSRGRVVYSSNVAAGINTFQFNGSNLNSGLYLISVRSSSKSYSAKMLLAK